MTTDAGHTHRNKADLRRLLDQRDAEIAKQSAELLARDLLIEKLKLQLANLRRQRFGTKSEALDKIIDQLELALVEAQAAAEHHDCEPPPAETDAKQQPTRKPLPDHLPREDVVLSPGETCEQCGGALRHLGEDVSEILEYVPGRFKVIRTVRPKLSCRCCETIHQVPAPSMPIERGRMGPGLIAHVLVSKYADHLPLYRQSQIYARERVPLERSTMSDCVRGSTDLLEVLADAIGRHVMAGAAIYADDTPVKVLAPGTGKTKTGRLWVYLRDERDWGGDHHPAAFVFCGGLTIGGAANITLKPGIYIFKDGPLQVVGNAQLSGQGVTLFFTGPDATVLFDRNTTIQLEAPTTGASAGILIMDSRKQASDNEHAILSNNARKLLGTIYLPNTVLKADATSPIADQSAYTAIVARRLQLFGSTKVVLKTDYHLSDVPVPKGIGGAGQPVRLVN